jgi:hypothetical protein
MFCTVIDMPSLKSANLIEQISDIGVHKTIRVNIHFILKTDGTGNFTETRDVHNVQNSYNGYWFANKVIERCNYWLSNNQVMTQQLSCCPIQVLNVNYNVVLSGVFFDKGDTYFNTKSLYTSLIQNGSNVINILVYPDGWGIGAASLNGNICFVGGATKAYDDFISNGDWGIDTGISYLINHETGHCLSLKHCKRTSDGYCCTTNSPSCLDDCSDTPTYLELINDGYTDPCIWNGVGSSNNIEDYSPEMRAFTPCQIEKVHNHIDNTKNYFKYGVFQTSSTTISSFSSNATFIASHVNIPSGSSITIPNGKRLYIDATDFEVLGSFEVPTGSEFEFKPYGL